MLGITIIMFAVGLMITGGLFEIAIAIRSIKN
jgi:hypothetical protein